MAKRNIPARTMKEKVSIIREEIFLNIPIPLKKTGKGL